MTRGRPGANV